jgi:hypothetical protein
LIVGTQVDKLEQQQADKLIVGAKVDKLEQQQAD